MLKILFINLKNKLRILLSKEEGAVAILSGLVIVLLIGFAALAIDVSLWYSEKRELQFAADAGAAGGAIALATTGKSTITTYATNDIALNNCTGANSCTIVAINNPPTSGTSAGNTNAVEVILSKPANQYLSKIFLGAAPTLHARAVAGAKANNNCVVALASSGIGVNVKGGGSIVSPNCGVYANSTASNAINVVGGGSITTSNVNVVGGTNTSGGGTINATGGIVTGSAPVSDPFGSITMPTPSSSCTQTGLTLINQTLTINQGTYCGGITLKSGSSLTLNPGLYFLVQSGNNPASAGSFTIDSSSTVNATGVTIVMTTIGGSTNYGTVAIPAQATVNMSAPTTGATSGIPGILFFGDRNSSGLTESFTGGTNQVLNGALYFPTNNVNYSGAAAIAGNPCFEIVSNTVTFTGGSVLGNGCPSTTSFGPIHMLE